MTNKCTIELGDEMEVGKCYKVTHLRKGTFEGKLVRDGGEFLTFLVTNGAAKAMLPENVKEEGEEVILRKNFGKYEEIK